MKNTKVLEMINNGEIDALKALLQDEIYNDSMKGNSDAKKRYTAMKRYQKYIPEHNKMMQKPCKITYNGKEYTSFLDGYCIALTTEPTGEIETYNNANNDYFKVDQMLNITNYQSEELDLNSILAKAKSKGYKYKKSEIMQSQDFNYVFHYKDGFYKIGILDQAFSIINDGNNAEVHYTGSKAPLHIITSIGECIVLPFNPVNLNMENKIVIELGQKAA